MKPYMSKQERKNLIFTIALKVAEDKGIFKFTLNEVAKSCKCSKSLIKHHYGGIVNLRSEVILYGRKNNVNWIKNTSIMELLV